MTNFHTFNIDENWIHFTGIAGIVLGQLAINYSEAGYKLTGSDKRFYEPMGSFLHQHKQIKLFDQFNFKNLIDDSDRSVRKLPKLIIAGGGISRKNKELLFAAKQNIPVKNFAEIVAEEIVSSENIVVVGSFGKTTTATAIAKIIELKDNQSSRLLGAISANFKNGVKFKNKNTEYSIIEGDEYMAARQLGHIKSKFWYYNPKYLVMTGYSHDHTDMFPQENDYFQNFKNYANSIPDSGFIVYNNNYQELRDICKNITHVPTYFYNEKKIDPKLEKKLIKKSFRKMDWPHNLVGRFNQENINGAIALSIALGISEDMIIQGLKSLVPMKRRLELKAQFEYKHQSHEELKEIIVIDDFGATPGKARSAIDSVKDAFKNKKIVVVFDPNFGSRTLAAISNYKDTFVKADSLLLAKSEQINQHEILTTSELKVELLKAFPELIDKLQMYSIDILAKIINSNLKGAGNGVVVLLLSSHSVDILSENIINLVRDLTSEGHKKFTEV